MPPFKWPLFDSLHIIALLFLFVKHFFASFFTLETIAVCHKNVVAVLCKMRMLGTKQAPPPEGGGLPMFQSITTMPKIKNSSAKIPAAATHTDS